MMRAASFYGVVTQLAFMRGAVLMWVGLKSPEAAHPAARWLASPGRRRIMMARTLVRYSAWRSKDWTPAEGRFLGHRFVNKHMGRAVRSKCPNGVQAVRGCRTYALH